MIREIRTGEDISILDNDFTNGLGKISFYHPIGTFALTPASYVLIDAIKNNQDLIHGIGVDWGSGVGCLAILAARIESVNKVYGLEISKDNVDTARQNADINGVKDKVSFILSDSYSPYSIEDKLEFDKNRGKINFILANPPSSEGDDGFEFRRVVLKGAKEYLCENGIVLLNISFQYSIKRVKELYKTIKGFSYNGVAASTDCVPFDLNRPDLLECLKMYAREESKGGTEYSFFADIDSKNYINAQTALEYYYKSGKNPLTKWQTHIFKYVD